MKKHFFYIFLLLHYSSIVAQTFTESFPKSTCGADFAHRYLIENDTTYQLNTALFEDLIKEAKQSTNARSTDILKIPIVVHIVHTGEAIGTGTNLSDKQIRRGIEIINQRFRNVANLSTTEDLRVELVLAVRDPNGFCTNGIVRKDLSSDASYVQQGVSLSNNGGLSNLALMEKTRWNPLKYYNIYIVNKIDGSDCLSDGVGYTAGFATTAAAHGERFDGAVIVACSYSDQESTTTVHELGHAFNLLHTFEGDENGTRCPTGNGDFCDDTPRHIRFTSHPNFSTEFSNCNFSGSNNCDVGTTQDHMNNYMDYSYETCVNSFTADQKQRVRTAITSVRSSYLESNGNLSLVPVDKSLVDFNLSTNVICVGDVLKCTDNSSCSPNSFLNTPWNNISYLWTFDDGTNTPITSTLQNPSITFTNQGEYTVSLSITTPLGEGVSNLKQKVRVVDANSVSFCTPTDGLNVGYFNFVIANVSFNTLDNTTSLNTNTLYRDFSCSNSTVVGRNEEYRLSILARAGAAENFEEQVQVYIDWNNNGIFGSNELVLSESIPPNELRELTRDITIPEDAVINQPLLMRVYGEANTLSAREITCTNLQPMLVPDIEDYTVFVEESYSAPTANYLLSKDTVCVGENLQLKDNSAGNVTLYEWNFEEASLASSSQKNTIVWYEYPGTYSFNLSISNAAGSDAISDSITVVRCGNSPIYGNEGYSDIFTVFPNPTAGNITITSPEAYEKLKVSLLSFSGSILKSYEFIDTRTIYLDMSTFDKGMYILNIEWNGENEMHRVLKM